ncbi:hypothetical protein EHS25_003252 [Saitozyma podzolica]|uniref:ubiquitinyl hydrolase 1 n=1 Tax=Saitozyma podzolica TaxID=1890683 RepID=A0A427Y8F8_9TREE|nr:hypothetical protein EHS25_003252 [Saitozyma podzolica]
MRRRRGTRSATPTPTPESPTQPSSSLSPPWAFAYRSPTHWADWWSWDPIYLLTSLWGIIVSLAGQTYWDIFITGREMALGLGRWWAGAGAQEEVEMTESKRDGGVAKVKRRRRKEATSGDAPQYFPGMVNLSGTLCYMNSVLQAFASMASLIFHLERIVALAVDVDIPTPVTDALLDVLQGPLELIFCLTHFASATTVLGPPALRPLALLHALKALPAIQRLLGTREQQDAHELFVVLAEAVSDEAVKVAAEVARLKGFGEVLSLQGYASEKGLAKDQEKANGNGRTAVMRVIGEERRKIRGWHSPGRVSWREGGCVGGVGDVTVDACIAEYLAPEHLTGVTCEMCSLRQTLAQYHAEAERLSAPPGAVPNGSTPTHRTSSGSFAALEDLPTSDGPQGVMTPSRKKRARDARRVETRLKEILDSGVVTGFGDSTLPPGPSSSVPIP